MDIKLAENMFKREFDNILTALDSLSIGNYSKSYETWKRARNILACYRQEVSRKTGPLKILDMGCSYGLYTFLLRVLPGLNRKSLFYGLDISAGDIFLAEKLRKIMGFNDVNFIVADLENNAFAESSFDIVICAEVIEHIADSEGFLSRLCGLIKPAGAVIITTPNKHNAFLKLKKIFSFLPKSKEMGLGYKSMHQPAENMHVAVRGANEWIKLIKKSGFKIESIKRGGLMRGGAKYDAYPVLFGLSLILDRLLDYLPFALSFTENITFKLRKPITKDA